MLKLNSELRAASRTTLSGNWTIAALVTLLYLLIAGGVSSIPKVGTVVSLIITYPLVYGFAILFLDLFREGKPLEIGKLFDGFKDFGRIWGTGILTYIIHSGFISGYQNRYGDNLKPPTNVYHRMTA